MPNSTRMQWPFPARNQDPWYEAYQDQVRAQDASAYAHREDRNIAGIVMGGGAFLLDTSADEFTWTEDIEIFSPVSGLLMVAEPATVTILDGQVLRTSLVRYPTVETTVEFEAAAVAEPTDDSYILGIRRGNYFIFRNGVYLAGDAETDAASVFGGGGSGSGAFIRIPDGSTRTIAENDQVAVHGSLDMSGTIALTGSLVILPFLAPFTEAPLVTSGPYSAYNNSLVPVDPSAGTLTILLPNAGPPGKEIIVKNVTSSTTTITLDGQGRRMDGAYTLAMTTAFDTVRLSRKANQDWNVL